MKYTNFVVVITIMSFGTFAIAGLEDGLIAHYEMEETSGTVAYDSTTNGWNLGPGSTAWDASTATTTGKIGNGFYFDGLPVSTATKRISNPTLLDIMPAAITIAGWVKPMSGNETAASWFQKQNIASNDQLSLDVPTGGNFRVKWRNDAADGGGAAMTTLDSGVAVVLDVWTHFAFTWDATTAQIYINGELENTRAEGIMGSGTYYNMTLGTGNLWLQRFAGGMDDVRIYDRVLSSEEMGLLAVPEPCTLLLLSLGGLLIRKRK